MASKGNWTIIFEDKKIIKNYAEGSSEGIGYKIDNDSFWNDSKFSNIWAIQYGTSNTSNEVEYRDDTPHSSFADANIGNIDQFTDKWDAKYLIKLQADWDNNDGSSYDDNGNEITPAIVDESNADKITRLGARPTSYSS